MFRIPEILVVPTVVFQISFQDQKVLDMMHWLMNGLYLSLRNMYHGGMYVVNQEE